ncbi:AraC family transcriptional regulator [Alcanivorax nanhaiticus]|uniref:AraC family transcriptional regulator n=1 Tax=Alcanivorax nanhaiticus TaxID=1177154 RepID=A0A095TQ42_9GAMM|nr:AraC family transcriptional regulator [Alcanivorax nanhaiticus]KGD64503.1 AraC family transcriptional regulator [Alcanivorax nanhaiticus]
MQDFARASALYGFDTLAEEYGLPYKALLKEAGLPENTLENLRGLVSYRRFLALLELSTERADDPLFGMKLGLRQGVTVFGPILYLLNNARTVGEALSELRQYFHLHMGAAHVEVGPYGDKIQIAYRVLDPTQTGINYGAELALGVGRKLLKTLMGQNWNPHPMLLEHGPQAPLQAYRALLGITPQFNSDTTAILLDPEELEYPLSEADATLHQVIREHLDTLQRLTDLELPGYVSNLLRDLLPQGRVTVTQVADCMAMSRRTLQRRLNESGTSFQKVLDDTRQNMALRYLRDSQLQVTQLSDLLGYADLSAFSRAFSRWFGVPPSRWSQLPAVEETPPPQ